MPPGRGWAGRQISPVRPCRCSLVLAMWNLEFKDQLCPQARQIEWANRKLRGLQGRGQGFRWGQDEGGCRLVGPRFGSGQQHPSPSPPTVGVCACHCALCLQQGEEGTWNSSTQRSPPPPSSCISRRLFHRPVCTAPTNPGLLSSPQGVTHFSSPSTGFSNPQSKGTCGTRELWRRMLRAPDGDFRDISKQMLESSIYE